MAKKLLTPDDTQSSARRTYQLHHREWLAGGGAWPYVVPLGRPTERDVSADPAMVRAWVESWLTFSEPTWVRWADLQWVRMGSQRVPTHLEIPTPRALAVLVGEEQRFDRACERYARCLEAWPSLAGKPVLLRAFDVLADYSDADFARLVQLVCWLRANPESGLTLRQVPVPGVHTKWVDTKRQLLVSEWLSALREQSVVEGFHQTCGLRASALRLRVRVLCPSLRAVTSGLCDIEAPLEELATLPLSPERVLVVENLESGLALPDVAGCVAVLGLGNAVTVLSRLNWAAGKQLVYWGDIDTHGFVILDRARASLGALASVLMDEETLLACRELWVEEPVQAGARELMHLTAAERETFEGLRSQRWGQHVRLEQERIPWVRVLEALSARWPR